MGTRHILFLVLVLLFVLEGTAAGKKGKRNSEHARNKRSKATGDNEGTLHGKKKQTQMTAHVRNKRNNAETAHHKNKRNDAANEADQSVKRRQTDEGTEEMNSCSYAELICVENTVCEDLEDGFACLCPDGLVGDGQLGEGHTGCAERKFKYHSL
ncbi:uncharacterized protein LOC144350010 [Saccoglossus kowalevskii]